MKPSKMLLAITNELTRNLPIKKREAFFDDVYRTANTKDLAVVHWQFLGSELRALPDLPKHIKTVIDPVILGMDFLAAGKMWPDSLKVSHAAFVKAEEEAAKANYTTAYACYAAAFAAHTAEYNVSYAAAKTAGYTANITASYSEARINQQNTLRALIKNAPNKKT